ncbi:MAG: AEC family transporter [Lachnospiraceae bacterium]|nr:AEC family transporter [Lachnospiraceae bacterium]
MFFSITLMAVVVMLLYAVPGYLLVKTKMIGEGSISAFAKVLMYVCQPCLTIYSFWKVDFSIKLVRDMLLFFVITLVLQGALLLAFYLVFRKKHADIKYRICTLATTLGNCTFMGVPLLEALFPEHPETVLYSLSFFLAMSVLSWTAASYIITQDKKYISVKKLVLNPAVLSMVVAIPIFVSGITFHEQIEGMITLLGRMTTPLCMLVMGMRLATMRIRPIFTDALQYAVIFVKQIVMPLLALGLAMLLPVDPIMKQTLFVLASTPVASVVLNFAEMLEQGQETAANMVLLGTLLSVVTIPVMSLLL